MKNSTNRNSSNDVSNASVTGDTNSADSISSASNTNDTSNTDDVADINTDCVIGNANDTSSSITADADSTAPESTHIEKTQPPYNPIYCAAQQIWEAFSSHLTGMLSAPVCVVSENTLNDAAQNALFASVKQLGFGERAITFVTLKGDRKDAFLDSELDSDSNASSNSKVLSEPKYCTSENASSHPTSETSSKFSHSGSDDTPTALHTLSSEQMFAIIEGVDPQVVIATDASSMSVLSHAYSVEFTENTRSAPARLLGRNAIGFVNFEKMLSCQEDKRAAWEHIKKLGTAPKAH